MPKILNLNNVKKKAMPQILNLNNLKQHQTKQIIVTNTETNKHNHSEINTINI